MCIFGIVMIESAIAGNEELAGYPQRQSIFVVAGLALVIIVAMIDYRLWASLARFIYVFAFAALFIIYVYGEARFGSARWIDTGLILIQPSEIVKILMIMVLAEHFDRTKDEKRDLRWIGKSFSIDLWCRDLDPFTAQPLYLHCYLRDLVCTVVGIRAAVKIPGNIGCCRNHPGNRSISFARGLPASPHSEFRFS